MPEVTAPAVTLNADGEVGHVQLDVRTAGPGVTPLPEEFQPVNPMADYLKAPEAPAAAPKK